MNKGESRLRLTFLFGAVGGRGLLLHESHGMAIDAEEIDSCRKAVDVDLAVFANVCGLDQHA